MREYLQDFNMVKIESRPQTMKISVIGSESYSGTKIPWTEMSVWVRIPPLVL